MYLKSYTVKFVLCSIKTKGVGGGGRLGEGNLILNSREGRWRAIGAREKLKDGAY